MIHLVDTNVLLRYARRRERLHNMLRAALRLLWQRGIQLRTTPQNFIEFWNVATRPPTGNGWGLTPAQADRWLHQIEWTFPALPDSADIYHVWRRLVVAYGVSGVKVHDARLVAAMKVHDVRHIVTLNTSDFARYAPEGIVAIDPATLLAVP